MSVSSGDSGLNDKLPLHSYLNGELPLEELRNILNVIKKNINDGITHPRARELCDEIKAIMSIADSLSAAINSIDKLNAADKQPDINLIDDTFKEIRRSIDLANIAMINALKTQAKDIIDAVSVIVFINSENASNYCKLFLTSQ